MEEDDQKEQAREQRVKAADWRELQKWNNK